MLDGQAEPPPDRNPSCVAAEESGRRLARAVLESIFLQRVGQGTLAFRAGVLGCVLVLCGANFRLNASTR